MKNPFNLKETNVDKPNRSNFDLSTNNHLSVSFGKIYPVLCQQCYPGDSFSIDSAFGLDAMPMPFPVQSSVRAHLHFYWVPIRILWKNWLKYISHTDDSIQAPYIDKHLDTDAQKLAAKKFFSTGSLSDYLGVPTTLAGRYGRTLVRNISRFIGSGTSSSRTLRHTFTINEGTNDPSRAFSISPFTFYTTYDDIGPNHLSVISVPSLFPTTGTPNFSPRGQYLSEHMHPFNTSGAGPVASHNRTVTSYGIGFASDPFLPEDGLFDNSNNYFYFYEPSLNLLDYAPVYLAMYVYEPHLVTHNRDVMSNDLSHWRLVTPFFSSSDNSDYVLTGVDAHTGTLSSTLAAEANTLLNSGRAVRFVFYTMHSSSIKDTSLSEFATELHQASLGSQFSVLSNLDEIDDLADRDISDNPFLRSESTGEIPRPISALPYRAYEAIYNCYYRNQQNDPFIKNGKPEYNEWITTDADGADFTDYHLEFRNWEKDFLTGALPSPQQGVAPLVGLTALGNVTIEDENGITTAKAEVDSHGIITNVVLTSPAASVDHARTAMNIAACGMSINDFRSANALQRFLESSLRFGYRYADQIKAHFGVEPKYDALDMPVFIGGVSKTIQVGKVIQNASSESSPLGSFAGLASIAGEVGHTIRHYCDEHGFIMACLSITPTPSYSQLLPKHFTFINNPLDYFSPEFARIGMQPVTYDEVCPIQAYREQLLTGNNVLQQTFGYQRPYYDMVRNVDTVHSLMRLSLRDYLVNRLFDSKPELGSEFLKCKPEQVNDVFSVTLANEDKFVGQVSFRIFAKRPLPFMSIPTLE